MVALSMGKVGNRLGQIDNCSSRGHEIKCCLAIYPNLLKARNTIQHTEPYLDSLDDSLQLTEPTFGQCNQLKRENDHV
ncbi:hypothetical protein JHK82_039373 [Glycine max]|nr:hypothetical protein JHK82_039373 [Glycine max]KAG5121436.1 hypothetical protein JHK84_039776 [Glycine max]